MNYIINTKKCQQTNSAVLTKTGNYDTINSSSKLIVGGGAVMKDIKLLWKKVIWDKSPVLLKYSPGEDWQKYWTVKSGNWSQLHGG